MKTKIAFAFVVSFIPLMASAGLDRESPRSCLVKNFNLTTVRLKCNYIGNELNFPRRLLNKVNDNALHSGGRVMAVLNILDLPKYEVKK